MVHREEGIKRLASRICMSLSSNSFPAWFHRAHTVQSLELKGSRQNASDLGLSV